jgi:methyltransferase family protein
MKTLKPILKRVYPIYRIVIIMPLKLLLHPIVYLMSVVFPQNEAHDLFYRYGYHLLRKHYYLPFPEDGDETYHQDSDLVGINIDTDIGFNLIENELKDYNQEFKAFPIHAATKDSPFYVINGSYMAIDGNMYYSLIRHHRPNKIIEIGSGYSTSLAVAAIRKNNQQNPAQTSELICVEPYPRPTLQKELPEITQIIEEKVQDVDIALFESLQAGDILFIDSTHVLRPYGDVWWEYCEILPRLAEGVLVHIHDISLPKPYPGVYIKNHLYWNEQYLLQAFLTFNDKFEVIWAGNYMMTQNPDRMRQNFIPEYDEMRAKFPQSEPSAFWMQVAR